MRVEQTEDQYDGIVENDDNDEDENAEPDIVDC